MGLSVLHSGGGCDECGTIKKSGKLSCCARGGAWFKNCGDVGDTKFDHTWIEGIQACKRFVSSVLDTPLQVVLRHAGIVVYPVNTTESKNTTQQQTNIGYAGSMPNTGLVGSGERFEQQTTVIFISVSFVFLCLRI